MRLWPIFLLLLACGDLPTGAAPIPAAAVQEAARAWSAVGLPRPKCAPPLWLHVDLDELESVCHLPACARPGLRAGTCAHGCTSLYAWAEPVAYYAGPTHNPRLIPWTEAETQIHETWHVWSECTLGSADGAHANARIWRDAWQIVLDDQEQSD